MLGAQHYLHVHLDARIRKAMHDIEHPSRKAILHHFAAQLGVCGMYRNIYRRAVHLSNARDVLLGQICSCYVVAVQKRKTAIVVLEIYRLPHSGRVLVNKAEDTAVAA